MDSLRQKATAGVDSVAAKAKEAAAGTPAGGAVDQAVDQAAAQAKTMIGGQAPPAPGAAPPAPGATPPGPPPPQ
jgi:hypothetical protein